MPTKPRIGLILLITMGISTFVRVIWPLLRNFPDISEQQVVRLFLYLSETLTSMMMAWMLVKAWDKLRGNLPDEERYIIRCLLDDLERWMVAGNKDEAHLCSKRIVDLWEADFGFSKKMVSRMSVKLAQAIEAHAVRRGTIGRWRKHLQARIAEFEGEQAA